MLKKWYFLLLYYLGILLHTKIVDQGPSMQHLQLEQVERASCHKGELSESEGGFRSRVMLRRGDHKGV